MSSRRLGRGLDALLPRLPGRDGGEPERFREVAIDELEPNPEQPRSGVAGAGLENLAASIRSQGVLEPIVVRDTGSGLQIVAGERRWRAARLAGLPRIPVVLRDVAEADVGLLALVENLQREDLNPIDEARAFRRLAEEHGLTHDRIAAEVGRSRASVTNALRLLELDPEVLGLVATGKLAAGAGRALLGLGPQAQRALAEEAAGGNLSVRAVESRARALRQNRGMTPARKPKPALDPNTVDAQERMERSVGLPVVVRRRQKGGTVRIRFYSEDDLHRIFLRLTRRMSAKDHT